MRFPMRPGAFVLVAISRRNTIATAGAEHPTRFPLPSARTFLRRPERLLADAEILILSLSLALSLSLSLSLPHLLSFIPST